MLRTPTAGARVLKLQKRTWAQAPASGFRVRRVLVLLVVSRCVVLVLYCCRGFTLVAEPQPRSGAVVLDTRVQRLFVLCLSLVVG